MKTNVKCDFSKIPAKTDFTARVMLELETNQPRVETRAPLEVALVLDHSGSMDGEKLDHVKVAARNLISRLQDDDVFSLTVFDHRVETIIPPTPGSESEHELDKIDEIDVGGTTNLSGGYRWGGKLLFRTDWPKWQNKFVISALQPPRLASVWIMTKSSSASLLKQAAAAPII